jgi:hypothetical protein
MTPVSSGLMTQTASITAPMQEHIDREINDLLASFPDTAQLSSAHRRAMIARYTAVLEGNFIYWMTGAYIACKSEAARTKIMENLHEEVRDSHPLMMRRFAIAAQAVPTDADVVAVHSNLTQMRLFIGRLNAVRILASMAFFEGFIQKFMPYLAELAQRQGSTEMEYTDVHGVCDITHTAELWNALEAEMALHPNAEVDENVYEGVRTLRTLMEDVKAA